MTTADKIYTIADLMALPDDDNKRYELWEGHLEEMSPTTGKHGEIGARLVFALSTYVFPRKLGRVFNDGPAFTINAATNTYFSPDVAFVAAGRVVGQIEAEVPVAPDLAVEIMSRHDYEHPTKFRTKIRTYQQAGVPLVWVIDPRLERVHVYRLGSATPTTFTRNDTLSGDTVLPGFTVAVSALFEIGD